MVWLVYQKLYITNIIIVLYIESSKSISHEKGNSNKYQSRLVNQLSNEVPDKRTKHLSDGFLNNDYISQDEHNIQNNKTEDAYSKNGT